MTLAGAVLRQTCAECARSGCATCNHTGYEFKDPYALTSGEMAIDPDELSAPAPRFVSFDEQMEAGHA